MDLPPFKLFLVPVGDRDSEVLEHLAQELRVLGAEPVIEEMVPAPADAYDSRRDQYLARSFLRLLGAFGGDRTLGVTDRDLYMSGLRFVFGQAEAPGRTAVISVCRLHRDADDGLYLERCVKEAVHELGHTFGLGHCDDTRCVMHFSVSLSDTDAKATTFCKTCGSKLEGLRARQAHKAKRGRTSR